MAQLTGPYRKPTLIERILIGVAIAALLAMPIAVGFCIATGC